MTAAVVVAAAVAACVVPAWLFETLLRRWWPGLDRDADPRLSEGSDRK